MFAVFVRIVVAEGRMPDFLPLMMENARATLGEPACLRFDVCTDPDRPDEVWLYEIYEDAAGFDAHHAAPHYKTFSERAADMVVSKDVTTFRKVEG